MKLLKFLKLKKNKKPSYTKLVLLIVIIIIILSIFTVIIFGGIFITGKLLNTFKSVWSKNFGSKSKFEVNMPNSLSRPIGIPKKRSLAYTSDPSGSRCMLNPDACDAKLIKKLSGRMHDSSINTEHHKQQKLLSRDTLYRTTFEPTQKIILGKLGVSPKLKASYTSSDIYLDNMDIKDNVMSNIIDDVDAQQKYHISAF